MKKILSILLLGAVATFASGQVSIGGKETIDGSSTILDFQNASGNTNGIILPAVQNTSNALASAATENNGTFLFDQSDSKLKMFQNGIWVDLSETGDKSQLIINSSNDTGNEGVIIGSATSSAKGVLVLESPDKAMILPKIAIPHENVKAPYAGMMCYDTASKTIAVFDGTRWNYWK